MPLKTQEQKRAVDPDRSGYYGGDRDGLPPQGVEAKVKITCTLDRELRDEAIKLGINRSQALELGLNFLIAKAKMQ